MPALYSHTTRSSGTILTAAIYNSDHVNHITNGVPAQLGPYSTTAAEMRLNTDPGESGTESLATSLAGELERLRFCILEMKTPLNGGVALTYWYQTASGTFSGTVADNAVTNAKLADMPALTVKARTANSSGDPSDLAASADGDVLRRSGTALGFGTIPYTSVTGLGTFAVGSTLVIPHTFIVPGSVNIASGDTDYICGFYIPVLGGLITKGLMARYRINSGTSVTVKLQKNGVDMAGFTALSVTTTDTTTDPADVTFANNDYVTLVVTAVSGSPKNMSFTIFVEYGRT